MAKLKNTTLEDIIPENLLAFKEIADICKVLKLPIGDVTGNIYYAAVIANFDILPEDVIDLLGWQWHVDYYDSSAALETKRALVKQSLDWHRHKGTGYAVDSILKFIAPGYYSASWQDYGGEPYHFRIVETDGDKVDYSDKELIAAVNSVKNVRSWLDGIVIDTKQDEANDYAGYLGGKHSASAIIKVATTQGYWIDRGYIDLYWNGYHIQGSSGEQYKRTSRRNSRIKYNASINKHTHYFDGSLENSGKEWMDAIGNAQKHDAEIIELVEVTHSSSDYMGYKRNRRFKMNGNIKYNSPERKMYQHTATLTITKGEVTTEEAV